MVLQYINILLLCQFDNILIKTSEGKIEITGAFKAGLAFATADTNLDSFKDILTQFFQSLSALLSKLPRFAPNSKSLVTCFCYASSDGILLQPPEAYIPNLDIENDLLGIILWTNNTFSSAMRVQIHLVLSWNWLLCYLSMVKADDSRFGEHM